AQVRRNGAVGNAVVPAVIVRENIDFGIERRSRYAGPTHDQEPPRLIRSKRSKLNARHLRARRPWLCKLDCSRKDRTICSGARDRPIRGVLCKLDCSRKDRTICPGARDRPIRGDHELVAIKAVIAKAWGGRHAQAYPRCGSRRPCDWLG